MPAFMDACALVKHFAVEPGSSDVSAVIASSEPIAITEWTVVESVSALARKVKAAQITRPEFDVLVEALLRFCASGRLRVFPVEQARLGEAIGLLRIHGIGIGLRSGDSLQLATAKNVSQLLLFAPLVFHTADSRLERAALAEGFATHTPT